MIITVYKVLPKDLHSSFLRKDSPYRVRYDKGVKTIPVIGSLFAFGTLEDAIQYPFMGGTIWEARAQMSTIQKHKIPDPSSAHWSRDSDQEVFNCWEFNSSRCWKPSLEGTILCAWIELVRWVPLTKKEHLQAILETMKEQDIPPDEIQKRWKNFQN